MKAKTVKVVIFAVLMFSERPHGYGQGTFINLNFEHPVLPLIRDIEFKVPITNALPGWAGYIGGNQVGQIVYNTFSLGAAAISLQGPGSLDQAFQGSYFVFLQSSFPDGLVIPAIAQTGRVPPDTKSLRLFSSPGSSLQAVFAGQPVPLIQIGADANYVILGGDITAFAGKTGELRFTGAGFLDNIQFSDQPIPEPSILALFGVGALLLLCRFRRQD